MKHSRKLAKITSLLLAGCVGGAATVWSPISCSCLSAWEDIATGLGHFDIEGPEQLTAPYIAGAIRDKFTGKTVKAKDLPFATPADDCVDGHDPDQAVRCTWWLWESGTKKKGYVVVLQTNQQGVFRRVVVTPTSADDA